VKNMKSGSSEYNEHPLRKVDAKHYMPDAEHTQSTLDALLEAGFDWEEAVTLLHLREHLYDNSEMRQRMENDHRMHFVRWLRENGEVSDN